MLAQLLQEICAEFYIKFSAYCLQRTHGIINSPAWKFPRKVQVEGNYESDKVWQALGKAAKNCLHNHWTIESTYKNQLCTWAGLALTGIQRESSKFLKWASGHVKVTKPCLIKAKAQKCLTTALYVRFNKCLITAIVQVSALQCSAVGKDSSLFRTEEFSNTRKPYLWPYLFPETICSWNLWSIWDLDVCKIQTQDRLKSSAAMYNGRLKNADGLTNRQIQIT